ncbi:MAG TPA: NAD(+)/NADH kinase [Vicinamibacterales bacterium]|jgi:NAD+ kinase|nr:NAD(+)/NADH kinase [Vicinamibacterales bacterium]
MNRISRVGLVAKRHLDAAAGVLAELAGWLDARGVRAVFETETAQLAGVPSDWHTSSRDDLPRDCDLIVVLGGDGTLIGMAGRIASAAASVPILGVNFGSLGFLTEITLDELFPSLESVLNGTASIEPRALLTARTIRQEQPFAEHTVLNDIVITKAALSRIIEMTITVGADAVTRVRADGLIVATPTGSTAYNLAAGGAIVHPAVDAVLITPIAPHTLANRPIVIPASSEVHIRPIMEANDEVFVTFDGQSGFPLAVNDVVTIRRSRQPLYLVKSANRTYFDVLRQKLKWGG